MGKTNLEVQWTGRTVLCSIQSCNYSWGMMRRKWTQGNKDVYSTKSDDWTREMVGKYLRISHSFRWPSNYLCYLLWANTQGSLCRGGRCRVTFGCVVLETPLTPPPPTIVEFQTSMQADVCRVPGLFTAFKQSVSVALQWYSAVVLLTCSGLPAMPGDSSVLRGERADRERVLLSSPRDGSKTSHL